ncbi:MAG: PadR family transcriptional regulator [Candidatus Micrarchaeota archaeon]
MNYKNAIFLVIALVILILIITGVVFYFSSTEKKEERAIVQNGIVKTIEFGGGGDYGYVIVHYNGTGNLTLIALSEQPKTKIFVLKHDFLNTGQYSNFINSLSALRRKGFSIEETDRIIAPQNSIPQNSIIIVPCGALPVDILKNIDNISATNEIVYLGKKDFIYTDKLERFDWVSNISASAKKHVFIIEKTLDEFYSEKNYSLFEQIEKNAWAEKNSASFSYSGDSDKTYFLKLNGAQWLRMLPLADSERFAQNRANISGSDDIFQWQKAQITIETNYSSGKITFVLEKDKKIIQRGELDRVRGDQAFFLAFSFNSSGDYLLKIFDQNGTMASKRIHVKEINVSLARVYGNSYEFSVLLDEQPLENASITIGLNHSSAQVKSEVRNGFFLVRANLKPGENIFVIDLFGQKHYLAYDNVQEDITAFYIKYLVFGALIVIFFYIAIRLNKKAIYKIFVPDSVPNKNQEIKLKTNEILLVLDEVEKMFGWENTPLYAREIGTGLKRVTNGVEVTEGTVETILKKMEEKGLVKKYLGLYGLSSWGDEKRNALKRIIKDKLIQNGVEFSETQCGFNIGEREIVFDSENAKKEALLIFEDRTDMRSYVSSLDSKKRAVLELKIKNGILRLTTLDELDELI